MGWGGCFLFLKSKMKGAPDSLQRLGRYKLLLKDDRKLATRVCAFHRLVQSSTQLLNTSLPVNRKGHRTKHSSSHFTTCNSVIQCFLARNELYV